VRPPRFRLEIAEDDVQVWAEWTGRVEHTAPPVLSERGLKFILDWADRLGVKVLKVVPVGGTT
jgi:hypothetical protein